MHHSPDSSLEDAAAATETVIITKSQTFAINIATALKVSLKMQRAKMYFAYVNESLKLHAHIRSFALCLEMVIVFSHKLSLF